MMASNIGINHYDMFGGASVSLMNEFLENNNIDRKPLVFTYKLKAA